MKTRVQNRSAFEEKGKGLLDFAGTYLSNAFPNPDREGCHPDAALQSLAFNPKESQPAVTEHLAACSPCFRRYAELLAELKFRREADEGLSWRRLSAWTKTHHVLAGTALACALLIAIGLGLLLRRIRQPNTPPMDTNHTPIPTEPLTPTAAYAAFSLDLSTLSPVRGSEPSTTAPQQRVRVPSSPLYLTLTLPLASEERSYNVRLTAGSHTVWSKSAQAHLHKGQTLIRVEADFQQVPGGSYNLEVESSSGIRLTQPVLMEGALPKGTKQKP
jgi:hypothetical protein